MNRNFLLSPQDALELFKKGDIETALSGIKSYSAKNPSDPDAYHLIGIILTKKGEYKEAEKALKTATLRAPQDANTFYNLGNCLMNANRPNEAILAFLKSTSLNPALVNAFNNLGNCYEKLSNLALAIESYKKAVSINPSYLSGLLNLSRLYFKLQKYELAINELNQILLLDANNFEALSRRGLSYLTLKQNALAEDDLLNAAKAEPNSQEAHLHLGNLRLSQKKYTEAISHYVKCLGIDSKNYDAISNIGVALNALKDYPRALECLNKAVELNPKSALLLDNRGVILRKLKRFDDAIIDHISAIELNPEFADAYLNLGSSLMEIGQNQEAVISLNQALLLDANCSGARFNLGLIALKSGKYEEGWDGYEYRWNIHDFPSTPFQSSLPRRKPLNLNQRLLIWGEQGIGDEIMFSRQLPLVDKLSTNVTVLANPKLIPLFSRSFKDISFLPFNSAIKEENYDCQLPIGSLGLHLRTDVANLSSLPVATLKADSSLADAIKMRYQKPGKLLCGISWKSGNVDLGKNRSIDLLILAQALNLPHISLLNLQYGDVNQEIQDLKNQAGIEVLCEKDADLFNNVDYLGSMIEACDLVVSISNVTIHLSGALGKRTWVLLPKIADWRWGEGINKPPWYHSLKLLRQTRQNDWGDVLITLKEEIRAIGD